MKIVIYNDMHIGDSLFIKSFVNKLCEYNNDIDIYMIIYYNEHLFTDIINLKIINGSINNNYNTTDFNGNNTCPLQFINLTNEKYLKMKPIVSKHLNAYNSHYYDIDNQTLYLKLWVGCNKNMIVYNKSVNEIECDLIECNNYYNSLIEYVNIKYTLNINKIPLNYNELPIIPSVDISHFINFKQNNKVILYYNFYPNSCQLFPEINHDFILDILGTKFPNYNIVSVLKNNSELKNVFSLENTLSIKKTIDCKNIAYAYYAALNSDLVFSFDSGGCFYFFNKNFNTDFKGNWLHCGNSNNYFTKLSKYINNSNLYFLPIFKNADFVKIIDLIKESNIHEP